MIPNLLVIGNGFDKQCGLKSSFGDFRIDFFKSLSNQFEQQLINELENLNTLLPNNIHESTLTDKVVRLSSLIGSTQTPFWHLYFCLEFGQSDKLWNEVEKQIEISMWERGSKGSFWDFVFSDSPNPSYSTFSQKEINEAKILKWLLLGLYKIDFSKMSLEDFHSFLLLDIRNFENAFSSYLSKELSLSKSSYVINVKQLLGRLELSNLNFNTLCFNYTNPLLPNIVENVHGQCFDNHIIIGIDVGTYSSRNWQYNFSKTSRKLNMFFEKNFKKNEPYMDDSITDIFFYGHSLNKQDFTYFKILFDHYSILGAKSKVRLHFRYTIFDPQKSQQIIDQYKKSVIDLMELYQGTIKSFDTNIISILLAGGRLDILPVEPIS